MDKSTATPDIGKLSVEEEEDVEDIFASPESGATTQKHTPQSQSQSQASSAQKDKYPTRTNSHTRQGEHEAREAHLHSELSRLHEVNRVITGITTSLTKASDNMTSVHRTVTNASTLLATWTRILSQTEHNQRLILNPEWQGASRDVEELESEDVRRQQEAERKVVEEQRRREEVQRRTEEEERRKALAPAVTPGRGAVKGRGTRGTNGGGRGYTGVGGQAGRGRGTSTRGATTGTGGAGVTRSSSTRGWGRGLG